MCAPATKWAIFLFCLALYAASDESDEDLKKKMQAPPKLLTEWKCPENANEQDWEPRCFKAEYYYTILGAFYYHGDKCNSTEQGQAAKAKIDEFCGTSESEKQNCNPEIRVSTHQDYSYHDFKERATLWEMEKQTDKHGWPFWKAKGNLKLQKVVDAHSLPHRCGYLVVDLDKRFYKPDRSGSISYAVPLKLPTCPGKTPSLIEQAFNKGPVRTEWQCVPANLKCGDNQKTCWCALVVYTAPTILLDKNGTNINCWKDSDLFNSDCELITDRTDLYRLLADQSKPILPSDDSNLLLTIQNPTTGRTYTIPSPTNYRCVTSRWIYGVVSAQLVCPEDCQDSGTKKCNTNTINKICGTEGCNITVRVMTKENYKSNNRAKKYRTPWHLEWTGDTGVEYRIKNQKVMILAVMDNSNPNEDFCARVAVEALTRTGEIPTFYSQQEWFTEQPTYATERVTKHLRYAEIPMPWWDAEAQKMPEFFSMSKDFKLKKTCGDDEKKMYLRVNFIVAHMLLEDRHGFVAEPPASFRWGAHDADQRWEQLAVKKVNEMLTSPNAVNRVEYFDDPTKSFMTQDAKTALEAKKRKWEKVRLEPQVETSLKHCWKTTWRLTHNCARQT